MDREATTMSVREMRELLGIKKTDSYWLLKKNCFEIVKISGKMRIVKKSFEDWYQNQAEYTKVTIQSPDGFTCAVSNKPFYPLNEASQLSDIPERDLYRMIQSHDLRGKKIGKSWYIRQEEMQDVMNQRKGT